VYNIRRWQFQGGQTMLSAEGALRTFDGKMTLTERGLDLSGTLLAKNGRLRPCIDDHLHTPISASFARSGRRSSKWDRSTSPSPLAARPRRSIDAPIRRRASVNGREATPARASPWQNNPPDWSFRTAKGCSEVLGCGAR